MALTSPLACFWLMNNDFGDELYADFQDHYVQCLLFFELHFQVAVFTTSFE